MVVPPALHVERRLLRRLRSAGAFSPETARPLPVEGFFEQRRLERLLRHGVVRETEPGRYYLDAGAYGALRSTRRRFALGTLALVALTYALMLFTCA